MPKMLSPDQVAHYRDNGYVSPLRAFDEAAARGYRAKLEDGERGHGLAPDQRRKMHLYLKWVDEVVHHPGVLDAVEDLIGPDILVYHLTLWMKEPQTDAFISWHQDSTYFGLSPAEHVTAWVALSPSSLESGCVQVVPGSHLGGQVTHAQEKDQSNLFATGQSLHVPVDAPIELMVLEPGQFSLHHTYLFHNSMPNRSNDRRIGLGISYIPTRCRCSSKVRLSASLARGTDRFGHFDLDPRPAADYDPAAQAMHTAAMQRWKDAREEMIPQAHGYAA
ncbi:MAG: phytanoyl-CoA dioxygenase family protein [Proteobacteria bacterium]|nr:phytanoyl-CoA dioxygenase family protein [Pseudomonadota bacterium]